MFDNGWVQSEYFYELPCENVSEILKQGFVSYFSLGDHAVLRVISLTMSGLTEMMIFIVGEMLAMFLYSKASGAGIGFLNQSTCPR